MINVTRLDDTKLIVNAYLIEFVELVPETLVCLTTGKKIMVKESVDEIVERVMDFRRRSQAIQIINRSEDRGEDAGSDD